MSPEVAIVDTRPEAYHVDVRLDRAENSSDPYALGRLRPIETSSDAEGGDAV
jgi:hypothetical protein